ncbi:MAG: hypothetical protein WCP60_01445 [bacterium]
MNRFRALALFALFVFQTGCSILPHKSTSVVPHPSPEPIPTKPQKSWHLLPFLPSGLPFFHHKPPPPRAQALQRVGVIRTVSADGSFVIIQLEPCTMIPPGRELIVTAGAGEPIHLQAAESQPPYFIADIRRGHPVAGQTVFQ